MLVRLLAIGDIGVRDSMMHIGDEAMFEALCTEMRARGVDVVAVSGAPSESSARYGVDAVARLGFEGLDRPAAEARFAEVTGAATSLRRLAADDPARRVIQAVQNADAVAVAGGGNLASRWPAHVYERAALARLAGTLGRPVIVSGQTLGPDLVGRDRELVGGMLRGAHRAGVRERASLGLASVLGVRARLGVDDASFLAPSSETPGRYPFVLVSLSLSLGGAPRAETVARIARLVDEAALRSGGAVRFHAHFGPLDRGAGPRGDEVLHDEVRERMSVPSEVVPTGDARDAAALARGAALLITGRYHPAVFAAPAGVPVLGLVTDDYTTIKQRGALLHWGQSDVVAITAADTAGREALDSLWSRRAQIADEAASRIDAHRAEAAAWWDAMAEVARA